MSKKIGLHLGLIKIVTIIFLSVFTLATAAMALDYPTKPIQLIVPNPPGGINDTVARILGPKVSSILGQQVIIVNKPGGTGSVGTKFVAGAKPDGYTMLTSPPGIVLLPLLNPGVGFNLDDFAPICNPVVNIMFLVVKADAPWKTLGDFIKEAKSNPGKLTLADSGYGSLNHFKAERLKLEIGVDIVLVHMTGEAPALTAVLGGHVNACLPSKLISTPHLKAGTLRALCVMNTERLKDFPDIPCSKELGFFKDIGPGWYGFFFPAKTPREIVEKVAKAFETAMKDKEILINIEQIGLIEKCLILEDATRFFEDEVKRNKDLAIKIKAMEKGTTN